MGNSNSSSKEDRIKYQNFVANYQFLRKIKDIRYGEISVLEDKQSKELVALKEVMSRSTVDFNKEMNNLKNRSKISHSNVIKLIGYTYKTEDNLCASFYKFLLIIEYLDMDIEREIFRKKSEDQYYLEEQLWYIADSLVSALSTLQNNNIVHGDIKPNSVMISKLGVYKIAEQSVVGNTMPSYHQRLSGFNDVKCYLSPHLLKALQKQELKPKHNPYKSDVFSLGMTLLHAASLQSCDRFYKWDSFSVDQKEVEQRIKSLTLKYSESFQNLLRDMLNFNEDARPDFVELFKKIQNSEKIVNEAGTQREKEQTSKIQTNSLKKIDSPEKDETNLDSIDSKRVGDTPPRNRIAPEKNTSSPEPYAQNSPTAFPIELTSTEKKQFDAQGRELIVHDIPTQNHDGFSFNQHELNQFRASESQLRTSDNQYLSLGRSQTDQTINISRPVHEVERRSGFVDHTHTHSLHQDSYVPYQQQQTYEFQPTQYSAGQYSQQPLYQPSDEVSRIIAEYRGKNSDSYTLGLSSISDPYYVKNSDSFTSSFAKSGAHEKEKSSAVPHLSSVSHSYTADLQSPYIQQTPTPYSMSTTTPSQNYSQYTYNPSEEVAQILKEFKSSNLVIGPDYNQQYSAQPIPNSSTIQNHEALKSSSLPLNYSNTHQLHPQSLEYSVSHSNNQISTPNYGISSNITNPTPSYSQDYAEYLPQTHFSYQTQAYGGNTYNPDPQMYSYSHHTEERAKSSAPTHAIENHTLVGQTYNLPQNFTNNIPVVGLTEKVTENYMDGSIYEGDKLNGLRHGKGKFYYSDGGMYDGDWRNGSMDGAGTLFYAGGNIAYKGDWREDKFHGKGVVFNEIPLQPNGPFDYANFDNLMDYWIRYEGDFINDNKDGQGILYISNGDRYQGSFKDDMIHGRGLYLFADGRRTIGDWWNNRLAVVHQQ